MSSIAGFISKSPQHDGNAIVSAMLDKICPPSAKRVIIQHGNAFLGWVGPCSMEAGAAKSWDGTEAIVVNGDLFNPEEQQSLASNYRFTAKNFAETVLAAFSSLGVRSLETHNGACCLAFHDTKRGESHIVRDRYGELPLFYTPGADYFAFSSDIRALYTLVPPRLNHDALSYRAFEFAVGRETLVRNIYSLEAGDYITVRSNDEWNIRPWWRIWDHRIDVPMNKDKAVDLLCEYLESAVHLRTKNLKAFGAMASGGVDSSLIASLAKSPVIYHAHYPFTDFNELEYAKCLADHIGAELCVVEPVKEDYLSVHDDIVSTLGLPCLWTSFTLWMVLHKISSDAVPHIFTGDGGDELFGGYHRYHLLYHDEQIHQVAAMQQYSYLINKYYGSRVERYAKLINRCENVYDKHVNDYLIELLGQYEEHSQGDVINFMSLFDFCVTSQVLLYMKERLFTHFNLEARAPMLDHRIVQLGFSMGSHHKFHEGVSKWILKKVASRYIPDKIVYRSDKRGFSAPVNRWFQWNTAGKYNRSGYRSAVYADWIRLFSVQE